MSKLRERFEAVYFGDHRRHPTRPDQYLDLEMRLRWFAWKDALEPVRELVAEWDGGIATIDADPLVAGVWRACRNELAKLLEE